MARADAVTVGTILNAAGLELRDHLGNVHGHGAQLGVGHETTGAEDLTDATNLGHHHGGGDGSVEVRSRPSGSGRSARRNR